MKKIAILTLSLFRNYGGGILQAYALQKVLKDKGYLVEFIQLQNKKISYKTFLIPLFIIKRAIKKLTGNLDSEVFKEFRQKKESNEIFKTTREFLNSYLNIRKLKSFDEIKEKDYDCYVVGSDQIWRPDYFNKLYKYPSNLFLYFTNNWNVKRISYAASFGIGNISNAFNINEIQKIKEILKKYNSLSVREKDGISICKTHFDVLPDLVLDPTFLLSREDYKNLIKNSNTIPSSGNLLVYILDNNEYNNNLISTIAKHKNLIINNVIPNWENYHIQLKDRSIPSPQQILRNFEESAFVICDSFHACVFSIIFNKPFLVIGNVERGLSRFNSLLSLFNLNNRLLTENNLYEILDEEINWGKVNKLLDNYKKQSMEFLDKAIKD